jgi:hypothetical protein
VAVMAGMYGRKKGTTRIVPDDTDQAWLTQIYPSDSDCDAGRIVLVDLDQAG